MSLIRIGVINEVFVT